MEASVIIPVFNAAPFIRKAVESVMIQKGVGEIILIEDNSHDDSLEVCREIEKQYPLVRLLRHDDKQNHGAGASRNLGIMNASKDFIAFLDADDFYLDNRFGVPFDLFEKFENIDGVYEAIGTHYYNDENKPKKKEQIKHLTTLIRKVKSSELFDAIVRRDFGSFSLVGLTVKRNIFEKYGYFDESLRLHQDSTWMIQMSTCAELVPGRLNKPVAMRGVHSGNRFFNNANIIESKTLARKTLFYWGVRRKLSTGKLIALFYNYFIFLLITQKNANRWSIRDFKVLKKLLEIIFRHPFFSCLIILEHFYRKLIRTQKNTIENA